MDKDHLRFKEEFLKLVREYPCSMGYFFQEQIDEFEHNHRPKEKSTHETADGLVKSLEDFARQYPNYKILPADDPSTCLIGYLIYAELEGKEISRRVTISLQNASNSNLHKIMKEKFNMD
jgi:hypothetical protein